LETTPGELLIIKSTLPYYFPFGNVGGFQLLCCQGFEVKYYDVTLDAWNLKPSDVCNVGVNIDKKMETNKED